MPGSEQLSDLQLAILRVLWSRGEATAAQVHADLLPQRGLAFSTIATVLGRLEKRGLLMHRVEGRQFVFRAALAKQEAQRSMLRELTQRVFGGDVLELVSHLLSSRDIGKGDLARVKAMIEAREKRSEGKHAR